jgi:hypothetical protein
MLHFGLIGDSFEIVHNRSTEEGNKEIKVILSEKLLSDLTLKSTSVSELTIDQNNIYTNINNEFKKITNPNELDIKEQTTFGISRGFKKGVFQENWDAIRGEVITKIKSIKDSYSGDTNDFISKKQILNRVNDNVRKCINELVVKHGFNYTYDVFYKLDCDMEGEDGKIYLGDFNIKNIEQKLFAEYSDNKLIDKESSIENCIEENKDLDTLISNIEEYIKFQKERLILQIKKEIIEALVKGKKGVFDFVLYAQNGKSGLNVILEKLRTAASEAKRDYDKLAIDFGKTTNPLKSYFPPLVMMVNGSKWKQGSDFDNVYTEMIPRDLNGLSTTEYGIDPLRIGPDSIEESLDKLINWMVLKNPNVYKDGCFYADSSITDKVTFENLKIHFFAIDPLNPGFYEKTYSQGHTAIATWKNKSLKEEFRNYQLTHKEVMTSFANEFRLNQVLYPTSKGMDGIETMCIYSGGIDLKVIAADLGYLDGHPFHQFIETEDNNMLSKIVFEVGVFFFLFL